MRVPKLKNKKINSVPTSIAINRRENNPEATKEYRARTTWFKLRSPGSSIIECTIENGENTKPEFDFPEKGA